MVRGNREIHGKASKEIRTSRKPDVILGLVISRLYPLAACGKKRRNVDSDKILIVLIIVGVIFINYIKL